MDNERRIPQKWINTPFAFTRFSKNLTLLQQSILVKVSERLQPFIEEFFGSDLCKSHDKPKELFSQAAKNSGIIYFDISYAELGVPANNYFAAQETARKVLDLKVTAPALDEKGKPVMRDYNIFSYSELSAGKDRVVFQLNTDIIEYIGKNVVDYVFDMSEKYVSHPDNITLIGKVDRMPMIYYLLRRMCNNVWKSEIKLTVGQIKEYLGMVEYAGGAVVRETYPKFSQFRKNVLDTSIDDINRLKRDGLLDVYVTYETIYNTKRQIGNPYYILFHIYKTLAEMQKAQASAAPLSLFPDDGKPNEEQMVATVSKTETPGEAEWQRLLADYKGELRAYLLPFTLSGYDGKTITLNATKEQAAAFESRLTPDTQPAFLMSMEKAFGHRVAMQYRIAKH
jgi:hypothetical protein